MPPKGIIRFDTSCDISADGITLDGTISISNHPRVPGYSRSWKDSYLDTISSAITLAGSARNAQLSCDVDFSKFGLNDAQRTAEIWNNDVRGIVARSISKEGDPREGGINLQHALSHINPNAGPKPSARDTRSTRISTHDRPAYSHRQLERLTSGIDSVHGDIRKMMKENKATDVGDLIMKGNQKFNTKQLATVLCRDVLTESTSSIQKFKSPSTLMRFEFYPSSADDIDNPADAAIGASYDLTFYPTDMDFNPEHGQGSLDARRNQERAINLERFSSIIEYGFGTIASIRQWEKEQSNDDFPRTDAQLKDPDTEPMEKDCNDFLRKLSSRDGRSFQVGHTSILSSDCHTAEKDVMNEYLDTPEDILGEFNDVVTTGIKLDHIDSPLESIHDKVKTEFAAQYDSGQVSDVASFVLSYWNQKEDEMDEHGRVQHRRNKGAVASWLCEKTIEDVVTNVKAHEERSNSRTIR
ncbi:uncharacterized protein IL334_004929 [Kwoniella shivajii]|uniref:Uncharacterized protein n=1 Tax=Kwoniella shivajii TaxID=564305 RepID=A0ABZ1D3G8_9TREE|nr:hypothetical protein IL334_004929 [Kwoniella shivajii]